MSPIYQYECRTCGFQVEHQCRIADRPESMTCPVFYEDRPGCDGEMRQVITAPAIQCDDVVNVPWIREFADSRPEARFGKKTIETRSEYKKYLESNGLRSADGPNLSEV